MTDSKGIWGVNENIKGNIKSIRSIFSTKYAVKYTSHSYLWPLVTGPDVGSSLSSAPCVHWSLRCDPGTTPHDPPSALVTVPSRTSVPSSGTLSLCPDASLPFGPETSQSPEQVLALSMLASACSCTAHSPGWGQQRLLGPLADCPGPSVNPAVSLQVPGGKWRTPEVLGRKHPAGFCD